MIDFQRIWNYYSRESILKALVEAGKDREVVSVYSDGRFGKRPDVIQYPQDVLQAVAEGTVAFHGSVERWQQPMKLDVGLNRPDLDKLRIGWDAFIDPDVDDFEIAKIAVKQIIEALKDHGVTSYSIKFTGGQGFHIGIPFEAFPEKINFQLLAAQYPDLLQKIIEYVKWYIKDQLREEIVALFSPTDISQRIDKPLAEISNEEGIEPFKIVAMDVFGSRHLFRLPYSLHEKTMLVSLPIKRENLDRFEKEQALPEKVKVEEKFLAPKIVLHDAEALIVEALDWSAKHKAEVVEELPRPVRTRRMGLVPEQYFPPCIQLLSKGLADGRKRSVFILVNFLKNMNWDLEKLESKLMEWNEKNVPPLRTNYLRTQLRWHMRQERNLLPPNCDNQNFYAAIGICQPDETCKARTGEITIKNPVNYPFRKMGRSVKKLKEFKKKR
jgi:hypothetical protein